MKTRHYLALLALIPAGAGAGWIIAVHVMIPLAMYWGRVVFS